MSKLENGKYRKELKRWNVPGTAHYLTFSTFNRNPFLLDDLACQWLCYSISNARRKHHFSLWAYVFMPDHVHLLIYPNLPDYDMGRISGSIKMPVSRKAIRYWKEHKPGFLSEVTIK